MQLVGSPATVRLRRLGLWRVDEALGDYLVDSIRGRWPTLRAVRCEAPQELQCTPVDAWLLGVAPRFPPRVPALLLGELARQPDCRQLTRFLLAVALPLDASVLIRSVLQAVAAGEHGAP